MASTTNYNWDTPDNSGLVKNGAQDMRTLGSAIDTSVWNIGFGQAGKNRIINGDFGIWQRGTSFTSTSYTADRWYFARQNTTTLSQQSFTAGAAPVAGYEGTFFCRLTRTSGSSDDYLIQRIEDVRTFANQTATISFWAKADTATTISEVYLEQNFGSGGSTAVGAGNTAVAITTSWVRYSVTVSVPSISGKTIGAGNFLGVTMKFGAAMGNRTIDIWGVQLEYGSKATPFETASGGSIQGELAMCQRYATPLFRASGIDCAIVVSRNSTTAGEVTFILPVQMRGIPTATLISGSYGRCVFYDSSFGLTTSNVSAIAIGDGANYQQINVLLTHGSVAGSYVTASWDTAVNGGFIMLSAEL